MNAPFNYKLTIMQRQGITAAALAEAFEHVDAKIEEAVQRIRSAPFPADLTRYVGHSGGKDSILVRYIADRMTPGMMTIHTPKPKGVRNEVHPATKEFLYSLDRPVLYVPEHCDIKHMGYRIQIDGTRAAEADRRDGRDVGLIVEGKEVSRKETPLYLENGLLGLSFIYPIYDWSDVEVWAAIFAHNIPVSPEYYE